MRIYSNIKIINFVFAIALVLMLFGAVLIYKHSERNQIADNLVMHSYEVVNAINRLKLNVQSVELQLWRYLQNKNKDDLEKVYIFRREIVKWFDKAKALTVDNSYHQKSLIELVSFLNKRFNLSEEIIARSQKQENGELKGLDNDYQILAREIASRIDALRDHEMALLLERNEISKRDEQRSLLIFLTAASASILLLVISFLLVNYQIIQRKKAEQEKEDVTRELRLNEIYKTAILEAASDGIITFDNDGYIVSANKQAGVIFGNSSLELYHMDIRKIIPDLLDNLSQLLEKNISEISCINNAGDRFPVEITLSEMKLIDMVRYVIIIRDITERKKVEKIKNEFISMVSHELRTPLTSIQGSLSLVLSNKLGSMNDKITNLLMIGKQNCDRLINLINDILDIQKIEAGKMDYDMRLINLITVIKDTADGSAPYALTNEVVISLKLPDESIMINGDKYRLMQVVNNLLSNAIKFSNQHEVVAVTVSVIKNHKVRISINNAGSVIPEEFRARIFQKFSQANSTLVRKYGGTGLGLNISKAIIEHHNGSIDYSSDEENGTTFVVELPLISVEKSINDIVVFKSDVPGAKKILVVEDDQDLTSIIVASLTGEADIVTATSLALGRQALSEYNYSLAVIDLKLPDGSGKDLLLSLSERGIPVIVYTSYDMPIEYEKYPYIVLTKSRSSNKDLLSAVKNILASSKQMGDI